MAGTEGGHGERQKMAKKGGGLATPERASIVIFMLISYVTSLLFVIFREMINKECTRCTISWVAEPPRIHV